MNEDNRKKLILDAMGDRRCTCVDVQKLVSASSQYFRMFGFSVLYAYLDDLVNDGELDTVWTTKRDRNGNRRRVYWRRSP